jgi:hypothetical protein
MKEVAQLVAPPLPLAEQKPRCRRPAHVHDGRVPSTGAQVRPVTTQAKLAVTRGKGVGR